MTDKAIHDYWAHLESHELDERFKMAVEWLGDRAVGKNILDLNCGLGRFCLFVKGVRNYLGNDTEAHYIAMMGQEHQCDHREFVCRSDAEMCAYVADRDIHVLVLFGATIGYPPESATLMTSFQALVETKRPEIVIIEGCHNYFYQHGLLKDCRAILRDYREENIGYLDAGDDWKLQRNVFGFTREEAIDG